MTNTNRKKQQDCQFNIMFNVGINKDQKEYTKQMASWVHQPSQAMEHPHSLGTAGVKVSSDVKSQGPQVPWTHIC